MNLPDVERNTASTFTFWAPSAVSPSAVVRDRSGGVVASGVVSVSSVATTATTPTGRLDAAVLADISGVSVGSRFSVATSGGPATVTVTAVNGATVGVTPPLFAPVTAAPVTGATIAVAVPPIGAVGRGYTAEVSDGGAVVARHVFSVVARVLVGPVTAEDVRRMIAVVWPGERAITSSSAAADAVAAQANAIIRARLQASEAYVSHYWDSADFVEISPLAVRKALADGYQLRSPGVDRSEHDRSLGFDLRDRLVELLRGAALADRAGDGAVADDPMTQRVIEWSR